MCGASDLSNLHGKQTHHRCLQLLIQFLLLLLLIIVLLFVSCSPQAFCGSICKPLKQFHCVSVCAFKAMRTTSRPVLQETPSSPQTHTCQDALSDKTPMVDHPQLFIDVGVFAVDFCQHYVDPVLAERQVLRVGGGALSDGMDDRMPFLHGGMSVADFRRHYVDAVLAER